MKTYRAYQDNPRRGTGRTTALMLSAIAAAIDLDGPAARFVDHAPMSRVWAHKHAKGIEAMGQTLHISLKVEAHGNEVLIFSLRRKAMRCDGNDGGNGECGTLSIECRTLSIE